MMWLFRCCGLDPINGYHIRVGLVVGKVYPLLLGSPATNLNGEGVESEQSKNDQSHIQNNIWKSKEHKQSILIKDNLGSWIRYKVGIEYRHHGQQFNQNIVIAQMPSIRRAKIEDLHEIQNCNLWCLPENYNYKYYLYHYLNFASQISVAEENNMICGYALTKMDDDNEESNNSEDICGHITSLSILRTHRRLGLASKLMGYAHDSIHKIQNASYVSLHVRVSNRAALGLYRDKLKYEVHSVEVGYYANGEDAYVMRKYLKDKKK